MGFSPQIKGFPIQKTPFWMFLIHHKYVDFGFQTQRMSWICDFTHVTIVTQQSHPTELVENWVFQFQPSTNSWPPHPAATSLTNHPQFPKCCRCFPKAVMGLRRSHQAEAIIWENVQLPLDSILQRRFIGRAICVVGLLFWSIPMTSIQAWRPHSA